MPNNNRVSFEKFPAHLFVQELENALNNLLAEAETLVRRVNSAQYTISNKPFVPITPEAIEEINAQNDELIAQRLKIQDLTGLINCLIRPVTGPMSEAEIDAQNQTRELVLKLGELFDKKEHEDNQNCRRPSASEVEDRIRRLADSVCAVNADQCEAVS